MIALSASGDTWGIPGPTFLAVYLGAAAVALVIVLVRRHKMAGGTHVPGTDHLSSQQAAYLTGGPDLAVYSAVASLRGAGLIAGAPGRRVVQTAPLPEGVPPLDTAFYHALQRNQTVRSAKNDPAVQNELDRLRTDLERFGLALSDDDRRAYRNSTLLLGALALLGVVRIAFGLINGAPVWYLFLIVLALGITAVVLRSRTPWMTRTGKTALAGMRQRYQYLSPAQSPAWATYGATGVAMGVALWGTASFYTFDPAFAADSEIERQAEAATTGGGGWSGDGGSSWSGGSDGGGGGSDGGGGGGCGGGGCGG
ncbi:uncharacterized protein (TIGR04222 family) [Catenuloplanes nepalensis]|uniref:Uncharacterized protein (TIGR04222 family) n=1 Tax=Catenuloplanes nepalensis TaxID=587533 RepID=A0ABT9ML56_9ACTN|nr:TIGR04222 domain-containing membrane protein [Catenuloplanes nepalensis]MDP9792160.1 uncharacterized protein (TIGR04222 family) [Catenuloplanes nepalensis]